LHGQQYSINAFFGIECGECEIPIAYTHPRYSLINSVKFHKFLTQVINYEKSIQHHSSVQVLPREWRKTPSIDVLITAC
jgi:cystathionine beta-lyase family protein involved in aluminum resistance